MNPGIGMLAALLATAAFLTAPPVPAQDAPSPTAIATRLLDRMNAGEYAQAESMFTAEMAKAVPAAKLKAVWESLPAHAGTAKGRGDPTVDTQGGASLVTVPLPYEKTGLVAKVAVAADGRISGFLIQPAPPPAPAPPADDAGFSERDFGIGTGDRALPGTLAIPKGEPPSAGWPTVVLVHGSGPHDRDETIGPNRPFLDIARGLAAQGIAVLRYEKRTQARPQDFAERAYTIDDETTDDAVAAIAALRATEGVDPKRVFVFGHSQGGMLAPRIALKAGDVAGLVLFAAPARPLLDILIEQNVRMAVLGDGKTSDAERAAIERLKLQVQTARKDGDAAADALPMGLPASYWRSTDAVDPVVEAREAKLPMLVLQGARDIQVVDADWQRWRAGFHDDPKVAFKLYEKLNHLGIAGEGEGSLAEYGTPGQLDAQLIADVAGWIEAH
ncbi:alpha/beta fold hydrolase [Lysobacter sp. M2-1]|uniref:alpha/beta hydrolase n=1 Tax=Lysobacter sp. M2-1 TaxID=2916839 RepID=UPI001F5A21D3|nr:alpha/beta fold hydrolase [Lysobacter sp. M2-1]